MEMMLETGNVVKTALAFKKKKKKRKDVLNYSANTPQRMVSSRLDFFPYSPYIP